MDVLKATVCQDSPKRVAIRGYLDKVKCNPRHSLGDLKGFLRTTRALVLLYAVCRRSHSPGGSTGRFHGRSPGRSPAVCKHRSPANSMCRGIQEQIIRPHHIGQLLYESPNGEPNNSRKCCSYQPSSEVLGGHRLAKASPLSPLRLRTLG